MILAALVSDEQRSITPNIPFSSLIVAISVRMSIFSCVASSSICGCREASCGCLSQVGPFHHSWWFSNFEAFRPLEAQSVRLSSDFA